MVVVNPVEARIVQHFRDGIETLLEACDLLPGAIADASQLLVNQLLADQKILVAANGASNAIGQSLVSSLLNRLKQERPSLPAMNLGADAASLSAIADDTGFGDVFAKQIRALGQAGDVLIVITPTGNAGNLVQAVATAHDRQMRIVALTGQDGGDLASLLDVNDIELRVPSASVLQIHQVHLLIAFCLCDLIEVQLFGTQDPP